MTPDASARSARAAARLRTAFLLALLPLLGACSTQPSQGDAPPRSRSAESAAGPLGVVTVSEGVRIVHDEWARIGYRWEWSTTPLAAGRGRVDFIDILDDVVAVQSDDAWTALIQASTGVRLWQVRNASRLTQFFANLRIGDVLLSCGRPELFLMELGSGNLIARQPVSVVITTRPVIYGGLAVFGTPTGEVLCHRFGRPTGEPLPPPFDSGNKEWGYGLDGAITANPVLLGRAAGLVTQAGEVFFVDIPTGSGIGRARISGGMATHPVTDGQRMFVASLDQSIYAFEPGSSTWLWRERTAAPLTIQPTLHEGVLYCAVPGEGLVAFSVSDSDLIAGRFGQRRWIAPGLLGTVVTVRTRDLVLWDGSNAVVVDRATGDVITRARLPRFTRLVASSTSGGDLYAIADNGLLAKFSPR